MDESYCKRDLRPEGSILLRAAMAGAWQQAASLASFADADGRIVHLNLVEHPKIRGIPLSQIVVDA